MCIYSYFPTLPLPVLSSKVHVASTTHHAHSTCSHSTHTMHHAIYTVYTYNVVHAHEYIGYTLRPYTPHSTQLYTICSWSSPLPCHVRNQSTTFTHLHIISAAARCKHTALSCVLLLLASQPAPAASAVTARGLRDALLRLLHFAVQLLLHVLSCSLATATALLLLCDRHCLHTIVTPLLLQLILLR